MKKEKNWKLKSLKIVCQELIFKKINSNKKKKL